MALPGANLGVVSAPPDAHAMNALAEKPLPETAMHASAPPPRRRRWLIVLAGLVVLVGAWLGGTWWIKEGRWLQSTDNAYVQGDIAVLGPRIQGYVAAVLVGDNQHVTEGEPLIRLRDDDWKARLASAEAALAQSRAAVGTAEAQIAAAEAQLARADAEIANAEAERTRAAADASRYGALVGPGWASRQTAEQKTADARKAEAQVVATQAARAAAARALDVQHAALVEAHARVTAAEAQVSLARIDLDNTVIRAPFDGIAGNRAAQLGQFVQPGTQLIAVAPPPGRQYVVANFKETQIARMRRGQTVTLHVDALPDLEVRGTVDSLAPATGSLFSLLPPENATGNFTKIVQRVPVKLVFPPEEAAKLAALRPGLSVEAEVDTRTPGTERLGLFGVAAATLRSLIP